MLHTCTVRLKWMHYLCPSPARQSTTMNWINALHSLIRCALLFWTLPLLPLSHCRHSCRQHSIICIVRFSSAELSLRRVDVPVLWAFFGGLFYHCCCQGESDYIKISIQVIIIGLERYGVAQSPRIAKRSKYQALSCWQLQQLRARPFSSIDWRYFLEDRKVVELPLCIAAALLRWYWL